MKYKKDNNKMTCILKFHISSNIKNKLEGYERIQKIFF